MVQPDTTHFGYQQVLAAEKTRKVAGVFDTVAGKYDLMNDLMSFGMHRLWKRFTVELSGIRSGEIVLDLAGGTGDLASRMLSLVGLNGLVVLADINAYMLERGRSRLIDEGAVENITYVQVNAEELPFPDNTFDCITIAFGLRNITYKERALSTMQAVLKPGGRVVILEFSHPFSLLLKIFYDLYSFSVLPVLGKLVAQDTGSYLYLAESIRMHPNQKDLLGMMEDAGFEHCRYFNLNGGIVAIHRGYKF